MDETSAETIARRVCSSAGLTYVQYVGSGVFKHSFEVLGATGARSALKVYKDVGAYARAERELQAMRRCNHPNIARLEAVATDQATGALYVLEEFVDGGTLADRLANGALTREETLSLGTSLVAALAHLEERRLVHRDLKPENIMHRTDGTPVIVDFGLVRDLGLESLTKTWAQVGPGTPYYAAPEQLNNNKSLIDWRTDQFAVGVVLAIGRFGKHPFEEDGTGSTGDTVSRVAARKRPSKRFLQAAEDDRLPCLRRMVEPWPLNRYRTPGHLIAVWNGQAGL